MNIFAYHPDPKQCALWLDDKRKNKMLVETAQLLCTAGRYHFGPEFVEPQTYKSTHMSHPCARWLYRSWGNYRWLYEYWLALRTQFGKDHMSFSKNISYVENVLAHADHQQMTPFANCARNTDMGVDFTHLPVHDAYREYHIIRWQTDKRTPTWNKGQRPTWYAIP